MKALSGENWDICFVMTNAASRRTFVLADGAQMPAMAEEGNDINKLRTSERKIIECSLTIDKEVRHLPSTIFAFPNRSFRLA